jgi:thioredoxin-related protein
MRSIIIIIFSIFIIPGFTTSLHAQSVAKENDQQKGDKIKWYSFQEAYNLNKKKPKKIFVDVFTDWCGWCKKMDAETFTNEIIVTYMNKHFYCVKLNAEQKDTVTIDGVPFVNPNPGNRRSTHQLANELLRNSMSYPSYVFLNEKSQWLTVVAGYQPAKSFEPVIHYFGDDAYEKTPWADFQSTFSGVIK